MTKKVIRADHSGFCFGVKQAIEKAEAAAAEHSGTIYSCGPVIHNKGVMQDLREKGVEEIQSLQDAKPGVTVIVRSHGEGKQFYEEAKEKGLHLVDATCPFVSRIHELVSEAEKENKTIIIIGDKDHPEVQGINGWCNNKAIIVNSEEEARRVQEENLFIVAQTTLRQSIFEEVVAAFRQQEKTIEINNTICNATAQRQKSCKETANQVDLMLIIGDKLSSNTKKLYDISKKQCTNTYFIENIRDLPLKEIEKCNRIGIAAGASTPECLIKEVLANMSENTLDNNEKNLMHDLMEEIEKTLRLPHSGEIVNGTVHQVTDKEIIVNLGCKKDGILPADEIKLEGDQKLTDLFQEGDEIQAKVIKTDSDDGSISLSRRKLEVGEHWQEINSALEDKTVIEVKVIRPVNGGVIAAYKEITGFIPLSQLSDHYVEHPEEFVGQTLAVYVSRVEQRRGKAVFSHRSFLNEERSKILAEIWDGLNVGDVVEGTIMRFTDYGAFVDIGGVDGLLHISEISWGKLKHPKELLEIGEKVKVKVLAMNSEKGKISLGLKQNQPEPWSIIDEKYEVGKIVEGRVVQIKEYGAFVELEPGLDGLVHISEVAHKRVTNIADEYSVGEMVKSKILEIDPDRRRISLSIREITNPEEEKDKASKKETDDESDAKPEPESEIEAAAEPDAEPKAESETAPEPETKPEDTQSEDTPEAEPDPEPKAESAEEPAPEPAADVEPEVKPEPESDVEPAAEPAPETDTKPEDKPEAEAAPEPDAKPEDTPEPETARETEADIEPDSEPKDEPAEEPTPDPETKPEDAQSEDKPVAEPAPEPDPDAESKNEPAPEPDPEPKEEPEDTPEAEPAPEPDPEPTPEPDTES